MSITKRYRVVIDYEVEISDWSPTGWDQSGDAGTPDKDWANRQRRLFEALIKSPKRLENYCLRTVWDALQEPDALAHAQESENLPTEDDLLMQTFNRLPPSDVAEWEESIAKDLFFEDSEFVRYRFQPSMQNLTLECLGTEGQIECESQKGQAKLAFTD